MQFINTQTLSLSAVPCEHSDNLYKVTLPNARTFVRQVDVKDVRCSINDVKAGRKVLITKSLKYNQAEGELRIDDRTYKLYFGEQDLLDENIESNRIRFKNNEGLLFHSNENVGEVKTFFIHFKSIQELVDEVNTLNSSAFQIDFNLHTAKFEISFNPQCKQTLFKSTPFSRWLGFSPLDVNITTLDCADVLHSDVPKFLEQISFQSTDHAHSLFEQLTLQCSGLHIHCTIIFENQHGFKHELTLNGYYDYENLQEQFQQVNVSLKQTEFHLLQLNSVVPFKTTVVLDEHNGSYFQFDHFSREHFTYAEVPKISLKKEVLFQFEEKRQELTVQVLPSVNLADTNTFVNGVQILQDSLSERQLDTKYFDATVNNLNSLTTTSWPLSSLQNLEVDAYTPNMQFISRCILVRTSNTTASVIPPLPQNLASLKYKLVVNRQNVNSTYINLCFVKYANLETLNINYEANRITTFVNPSDSPQQVYFVKLVDFPVYTNWILQSPNNCKYSNIWFKYNHLYKSVCSKSLQFTSPHPLNEFCFKIINQKGEFVNNVQDLQIDLILHGNNQNECIGRN